MGFDRVRFVPPLQKDIVEDVRKWDVFLHLVKKQYANDAKVALT
jgi:hypothetical protein